MQSFGSRFRGLLCLLMLTVISMSAEADAEITIGQTFVLTSKILDEPRRINVFTPTHYGQPVRTPLPVIYMPDGGMNEDFLHIAGLLQVLVSNGTMRPFRLVGIENTERHRDMTGPTSDPKDQGVAPQIGGSVACGSQRVVEPLCACGIRSGAAEGERCAEPEAVRGGRRGSFRFAPVRCIRCRIARAATTYSGDLRSDARRNARDALPSRCPASFSNDVPGNEGRLSGSARLSTR